MTMIFEAVQAVLLCGTVAAAVMAARSRDLLYSAVCLGAMSLLLSLEFYVLQAPDVAIAEAAIGAGLTTAIYVISIKKTARWEDEENEKH